jgi:Flp pilus assembly protein TadG
MSKQRMNALRNHSSRTARLDQRPEPRSGVAATEFAIVLPLFLTLVLGVLEIGRSLETSTTMYAALREAGRLAGQDYQPLLPSGTTINEKVEQDIRNFLTASGLDGDDFDITIEHADGGSAGSTFDLSDADNQLQLFKLTAEVEYSEISIFPFEFMAGQTLRSSLVFRLGRVQLVD